MGIFRRSRQSGQDLCVPDRLAANPVSTLDRGVDEQRLGRCEAEAIGPQSGAADPYAVWLQRRESERLQDQPAIRWVYRYPITVGRTGDGVAGGTREASGERRPGTEGGLVGVA